jgi:hypothetical protein
VIGGGDASLGSAGGQDDGAVAEHELDAMVSDAKTFLESERAAEPFARFRHVVVGKHGDDGGAGHRSVDDHAVIVSIGP